MKQQYLNTRHWIRSLSFSFLCMVLVAPVGADAWTRDVIPSPTLELMDLKLANSGIAPGALDVSCEILSGDEEVVPQAGIDSFRLAMNHDSGLEQTSQLLTLHDQQHKSPLYRCPMHPGEVSDQPGRCSICGMFLEKAEEDDAAEEVAGGSEEKPAPTTQPSLHDHGHDHGRQGSIYACPMHPDEISDQPGRCGICGMFLVKEEGNAAAKEVAGESEETPAPIMQQRLQVHDHDHVHQNSTYVCPMHPQIVSPTPSSCPICGMDLVKKVLEEVDSDLPAVTLSAAVMQSMGVRLAKAQRGLLGTAIRTQGRVAYDDDRIIQVHPRTSGWIENLYVRTDGVRVERKDDLADYFSPDVLWAQQEYISSLEEGELESFGGSAAVDPARTFRERSSADLLRYFKVPSMDIMGLKRSMEPKSVIPIRAPQGGVLIEHNIREGMFVTPADNMFTIADLSEVWIMVDIFEHQLAWVRSGLTARVSSPAFPGHSWHGELDFVYPEVDPKSRTLRARLEVKNPNELLMPNMFVQVDLSTEMQKAPVLTVPREAVIITGERELVIKALGEGRFQPVEVVSGLWSDGKAEILSGLDEGDEVVVSGQFLIDSESSLRASFLRMSE